MAGTQNLLSTLRTEFKRSPVASNVIFCFILIGLEKIVEWEFECPCDPELNLQLALAFSIVPTVIIFLLMILVIQKCSWENFFLSLIPTSIWLNLVFLDGKYFACAKTNWPGEYVTISGSPHFKWCKPVNETLTEKYMEDTQFWFTKSQSIGIWSLLIIPIGYVIYKCCEKTEDEEPSTRQDMEASSV